MTSEYPDAGTPQQHLISTLDCPRVGGRGVGAKHKDFLFVCVDMVPPFYDVFGYHVEYGL